MGPTSHIDIISSIFWVTTLGDGLLAGSELKKDGLQAKVVPVSVATFYWVREVHSVIFHITFPDITELILDIITLNEIIHHEGPAKKTAISLMVGDSYLRAKTDPLFFLPAPNDVFARSQYLAPHFRVKSKHAISTKRDPFYVEKPVP